MLTSVFDILSVGTMEQLESPTDAIYPLNESATKSVVQNAFIDIV